jgi:hypothetical protein
LNFQNTVICAKWTDRISGDGDKEYRQRGARMTLRELRAESSFRVK